MTEHVGIAIGGCAYRSMVHVAHASSVAGFVAACAGNSLSRPERVYSPVRLHYQHTSNLPQGRSLWLRSLISNNDIRFAISVDSDNSFDPPALLRQVDELYERQEMISAIVGMVKAGPDSHGYTAIAIAPVVRKRHNGISLNIFTDRGRPLSPKSCGIGYPALWAGGFGLAVFDLDWFRWNWREPYPEIFGEPGDSVNQGEDIQMCRSVISRGAKVTPLWVSTKHFDCSGGEIIGGSVAYDKFNRMIVE